MKKANKIKQLTKENRVVFQSLQEHMVKSEKSFRSRTKNKKSSCSNKYSIKVYSPEQIDNLWEIVQSVKQMSFKPIEIENVHFTNPTMKVYSKEQLSKLGQIASKHVGKRREIDARRRYGLRTLLFRVHMGPDNSII